MTKKTNKKQDPAFYMDLTTEGVEVKTQGDRHAVISLLSYVMNEDRQLFDVMRKAVIATEIIQELGDGDPKKAQEKLTEKKIKEFAKKQKGESN